jgi:hypothetical protein
LFMSVVWGNNSSFPLEVSSGIYIIRVLGLIFPFRASEISLIFVNQAFG